MSKRITKAQPDARATAPDLAALPVAAAPAPNDWALVWSDEFEGDQVDPAKWDFDLGNGFFDYKTHQWIAGWGNEELQYYTRDPANVSVKDSLLTIRAVKESLHGCGYTSARLKTRKRDGTPLFAQRYGRFDFRAKVPCPSEIDKEDGVIPIPSTFRSEVCAANPSL